MNDKQLTQLIISVLQDSERSGTPATFSTEQVVQIVALGIPLPLHLAKQMEEYVLLIDVYEEVTPE